LEFLSFVVQLLLFVYHFLMSFVIQGSDRVLKKAEYLKGLNWFTDFIL